MNNIISYRIIVGLFLIILCVTNCGGGERGGGGGNSTDHVSLFLDDVTSNSVTLWINSSYRPAVADIYRDDNLYDSVDINYINTIYMDTNVISGEEHFYWVEEINSDGNTIISNRVTVRIP